MIKLALITDRESFMFFNNFFQQNKKKLEKLTEAKLELISIYNNSSDTLNRELLNDENLKVRSSLDKILRDPEIDIIIELTRQEDSPEYLFQALKNKKIIITTNSKLLAENFKEIKKRENKYQSKIFFSAAFSPLPLNKLIEDFYSLDQVKELNAVFNASTNYILSEMEKNTVSMKESLETAKNLSYVEANPEVDLTGLDSLYKNVLTAELLFQQSIDSTVVDFRGIKGITSYDLIYAGELGYKIKLVSTIKKNNEKLYLGVRPNLVAAGSFLASVNENSVGVEILSNYNGWNIIKSENNKNADVNLINLDLIKAVNFIKKEDNLIPEINKKELKAFDLYQQEKRSFYIRLQLEKDEQVVEQIKEIFSEKNLADLILHDNLTETPILPLIIITKKIKEKNLEELLKEVENLEGVLTVNNIIAVKQN